MKSTTAELTLSTNSLAPGNLCKCLIQSQGEWEIWGSQVEVGGGYNGLLVLHLSLRKVETVCSVSAINVQLLEVCVHTVST